MAEQFGDSSQNEFGFGDDFGADAVAGEKNDRRVHGGSLLGVRNGPI